MLLINALISIEMCLAMSIGTANSLIVSRDLVHMSTPALRSEKVDWLRSLKRQFPIVQATRRAVVSYLCPISGPQTTTFQWTAHYDAQSSGMTLLGQENIDHWDHVMQETNNFACKFHHRNCKGFGEHCCVHSYQATVIGTVYETIIDMTLVSPRMSWADRVRVTELCVFITGDLMCMNQPICPVQAVQHQECHVTNTVVSIV